MGIDQHAVDSVPAGVCVEYKVMPVRRDGPNLWLAMSDPNDKTAIEAVRSIADIRVIPVLATPPSIETAIAKYYVSS